MQSETKKQSLMVTVIVCLALMLGFASTSYGDVILGNFENADSNDNWIPGIGDADAILVPASTSGVTLDSGALKFIPSPTGNYWSLEWEGPPLDLTDASLQFDLTMVASEWTVGVWTKVADKIAINSDGPSGWYEWNNLAVATDRDTGEASSLDWGRWWMPPLMHARPSLLTFRTMTRRALTICRFISPHRASMEQQVSISIISDC